MSEFSYTTQFGSIHITYEQNVITAIFKGSVSLSIAEYFVKAMELALKEIELPYWGYVSYSNQAEATTPDAYDLILKTANKHRSSGCVAAAHVLTSSIAIYQTQKIRDSIGLKEPLEECLFDNINDAKVFVLKELSAYENKQKI
jgi:hypothetical protein